MKKLLKKYSGWLLTAVVIGSMALLSGCSSDDDDDDDAPAVTASQFIGTWALRNGSATAGSVIFYVFFESNNTFVISDTNNKNNPHMTGTWSESNGTLDGPFSNPGVGDGKVVCTVNNNILTMDFIEYWHTPNKHIAYTGTKV